MFGGVGGINVIDLRNGLANPHFVGHGPSSYMQQVEHTGKDLLLCSNKEIWVGEISS